MAEKVLVMKNIVKEFPGVIAVNDVDLELRRGEVLALCGENGAGKSTLIKVLSGAHVPDSGEVWLDGEQITQFTPRNCIEKGIRVIYQEFNNFETISIAENIFAGNIPVKGKAHLVDNKTMIEESIKSLKRCGVDLDPNTKVSMLSVAQRQIVEIAKAITGNAKVLVMDEPTAALNEVEVKNLFEIIHRIQEEGTPIIYISHRLDEIFGIANRVQVMRDGKSVFVSDIDKTTRKEIVANMVGSELKEVVNTRSKDATDVIMQVKGLSSDKYRDVTFNVCRSEVVTLYGLMGAGQSEVMETIFGIRDYENGEIEVNGKKLKDIKPAKAKKNGIGYVPSDRKRDALTLKQSISENIVITNIDAILNHNLVSSKKERTFSNGWIKKLNIRTTSPDNKVSTLSGGNQQKVVMAKWLAAEPDVLMLNEPTRGVDVGAKAEIYGIIDKLLTEGKGVLMVSSDLPEVLGISDRVYVFCEGRIVGEYKHKEITPQTLLESALGGI